MDANEGADLVETLYYEVVTPICIGLFENELSDGGRIYEMFLQQARRGADVWYGMYHPIVYHRGMTLSDPGNIEISHGDIQVDGNHLTSIVDIQNISPHIKWTSGFMMRNGRVRPGGDVYKFITDVEIELQIPDDVMEECLTQVFQHVFDIMNSGQE